MVAEIFTRRFSRIRDVNETSPFCNRRGCLSRGLLLDSRTRCQTSVKRHLWCACHIKPARTPIYIQHNLCSRRCLLERRALWSQNYEAEMHMVNTVSNVVRPSNAARNEHASKTKKAQTSKLNEQTQTRLFLRKNKQTREQFEWSEPRRETHLQSHAGPNSKSTAQQQTQPLHALYNILRLQRDSMNNGHYDWVSPWTDGRPRSRARARCLLLDFSSNEGTTQ